MSVRSYVDTYTDRTKLTVRNHQRCMSFFAVPTEAWATASYRQHVFIRAGVASIWSPGEDSVYLAYLRFGIFSRGWKCRLIVVGKPAGNGPRGRPTRKLGNNIMINLRETGFWAQIGFIWIWMGTVGGLLWTRWWMLGFMKGTSWQTEQSTRPIGSLVIMGWDWRLRTAASTGLLFIPRWLRCGPWYDVIDWGQLLTCLPERSSSHQYCLAALSTETSLKQVGEWAKEMRI
jgi:hypothetical protein